MKLFITASIITVLVGVILAVGVVIAQIPTETSYRNPACAVPSYTVEEGIYDRYSLIKETVKQLAPGPIRDNLNDRLAYVYEEINIRCLEEMIDNPQGYMSNKAAVEKRFEMYKALKTALSNLNDARPAKKTELITRLGVIRNKIDGFELPAEVCPVMPTLNASYTPSDTFAVIASVTNATPDNIFSLDADDTLSWASDISETLYETSGQDVCEFACNATFEFIDEAPQGDHRGICGCPLGTHEFEGTCLSNQCQGTEPTDVSYAKGADSFTSGPSQSWTFDAGLKSSNDTLPACQYTCADDYTYGGSGDRCINAKTFECTAKPDNSIWNTDSDGDADGRYAQTYTDATGWQPVDTVSTTYDPNEPYAQCSYRCGSGYHYYDNACVTNTCGGTKPSGLGVKIGRTTNESGPEKNWTYSSSGTLGACEWKCESGYVQNGLTCKQKTWFDPEINGSYHVYGDTLSGNQFCVENGWSSAKSIDSRSTELGCFDVGGNRAQYKCQASFFGFCLNWGWSYYDSGMGCGKDPYVNSVTCE